MTSPLLLALALAAGEAPAAPDDPALAGFIAEALAARPELAQARAETRAAAERVPQARAFPEPMLQVGVQNDGFTSWQVGKMDTSFIQLMASQTFPFPGKQALRGELAQADVRVREAAAQRAALGTVAEVRRAYLALQLAQARLGLLERLQGLLEKSAATAESRYATGGGPQADLLRARLELARLGQRRATLEAEAALQAQALNRLRGQPLQAPVEGVRPLAALPFPPAPEEAAILADGEAHSPELAAARTGEQRGGTAVALGHRDSFPDLSVGAGVMLRFPLEPMWTVTLGVPLPVYAGARQARAVAEAEALQEASRREGDAVVQLLALRTRQRLTSLQALREVWRVEQGSLVRTAAAVADSTLAQYRVGGVPFAAVLEATAGAIAEEDAALQVLVDAWRLAIAQDELSLAEPAAGGTSMGASIPGAGMSSGKAGGAMAAGGASPASASTTTSSAPGM